MSKGYCPSASAEGRTGELLEDTGRQGGGALLVVGAVLRQRIWPVALEGGLAGERPPMAGQVPGHAVASVDLENPTAGFGAVPKLDDGWPFDDRLDALVKLGVGRRGSRGGFDDFGAGVGRIGDHRFRGATDATRLEGLRQGLVTPRKGVVPNSGRFGAGVVTGRESHGQDGQDGHGEVQALVHFSPFRRGADHHKNSPVCEGTNLIHGVIPAKAGYSPLYGGIYLNRSPIRSGMTIDCHASTLAMTSGISRKIFKNNSPYKSLRRLFLDTHKQSIWHKIESIAKNSKID